MQKFYIYIKCWLKSSEYVQKFFRGKSYIESALPLPGKTENIENYMSFLFDCLMVD